MKQRKRVTKYRTQTDLIYHTNIKGRSFENGELKLESNGRAVVKEGFRSDGCSPTFKLPFSKVFQFGWIVGPPNGPRNPDTGLPISARAFFLHDCLLDNVKHIVNTREMHREFCREINLTDWRWKEQACWLVCKLGPKR